jgi:hypothetical protein
MLSRLSEMPDAIGSARYNAVEFFNALLWANFNYFRKASY